MRKARLLLLTAGFLILVIPAWADKTLDAGSFPTGNLNLLPDSGIDVSPVGFETPRLEVSSRSEIFTGTFVDTLPPLSVELPALVSPVRVDLMLEEVVVGVDSIDGVGVMISW